MDLIDVAPRRGAWIETLEEAQQMAREAGSHPAGVRGLKQLSSPKAMRPASVAPRRGAWIETVIDSIRLDPHISRTPQGCVD